MAKGSSAKIPYTLTRIGKHGEVRYLHLSAALKRQGVTPLDLGMKKLVRGEWKPTTIIGRENAETRIKARQISARCAAIASGDSPIGLRPLDYERGTFGHFFEKFRARQEERLRRGEIKERTYSEWVELWNAHIKREIGSKTFDELTIDCLIKVKERLEDNHSHSVRHKVMARIAQLMKSAKARGLISENPFASGDIPNPTPQRRKQFWLPSEWTGQLIPAAPPALALVMRIMYETARNPVDAHQLPRGALCRDAHGPYIDRAREKTGAEGMQEISEQLYADLIAYHEALPFDVLPNQPFLMRPVARTRGSRLQPWKDESEFAKDFRRVREAVFGKDETRTAKDIRKTANLEMKLGGAEATERAALMANALHKNQSLDQTYTPATLALARKANATRQEGRNALENWVRTENEQKTA